jgi:ferritin-like metal-binding protein YciE
MTTLQSLEDVFESDLKDLFSAEKQLVEALPAMVSAATSKELASAIEDHSAAR